MSRRPFSRGKPEQMTGITQYTKRSSYVTELLMSDLISPRL